MDNSGEVYNSDNFECSLVLGDNLGGILAFKVVPYDGGSRREIAGTDPGYVYNYEEVIIQDANALLIERGPVGESGSAAIAVVPKGHGALIVSLANTTIDDVEFNNILKSIELPDDLLLSESSCGN